MYDNRSQIVPLEIVRGRRPMDQTLLYLKNAEKLLKSNQFTDDEEYQLFLQNVFTELDGMEYRLACSHDGSSLVEIFLRSATPFQLAVFFDRLAGKYEAMAAHRYASHVLETIFEAAGKALASGQTGLSLADSSAEPSEAEGLLPLDQQIIRAFDELKVSIISAIHDSYGSHVWRSLIQLFGVLPQYFHDTLSNLVRHLLDLDEGDGEGLRDLCFQQFTAPFLQELIKVLHRDSRDLRQDLLSRLLFNFDFDTPRPEKELQQVRSFWKRLMEHDIGSHCCEVVIDCLTSQQVQTVYGCLIRGHSVEFLSHPRANYPLQHLISAFGTAGQVSALLEELQAILPAVIEKRRFGILCRAAEWAVQHNACHEEVVHAALATFHLERINEDRQCLFNLSLKLQAKGSSADLETADISPQGCAFLIHLAKFPANRSKFVVDGLLRYTAKEEDALKLARHPQASRVLEAFLVGGGLSAKAIERIARQFKGHMIQMATDKFASHVVERLWKVAQLPLKNVIMEELSLNRERLESTPQGRSVTKNCRLDQFVRHRDDWVKEEQGKVTKRSLFDEILND